jgi:YD repeat-containing protein
LNKFAYSGAGDLLTLTDGNGDKTGWNYDFYGRVTNKLDHAGVSPRKLVNMGLTW